MLVVGTFATTSPHAERNSDGLIVYTAMRNDTEHWETTGGAAIPAAASRGHRPSKGGTLAGAAVRRDTQGRRAERAR